MIKESFFDNKESILIYLIILVIFSLLLFDSNNYAHPKAEIGIFIILAILGVFLIIYYSKNKDNLHKVAFIIILVFGLLCVFTSPLLDVSDEGEHLARSALVSEGNIFPDYIDIPEEGKIANTKDSSYNSTKKGYLLHTSLGIPYEYRHKTILETDWDNQKISYNDNYLDSVFSQNPFYGYLASAIGIDIAKLLDLNNIWMLWLGKACNLLLYALICAIAIKITPVFKYPLLIFSTLPLAVYQGASFSIDSLIISIAILTIAYFFYLFKLPKKSIDYKKILPFFILCLILGLSKVTLFSLVFLVFLIPRGNFQSSKYYILSVIAIIGIIAIGLVWTQGYASSNTYDSWRGDYFASAGINESAQLEYIIGNPESSSVTLFQSMLDFNQPKFLKFFTFGSGYHDYSSNILNILYCIFLLGIIFLYPSYIDIKLSKRVEAFIIFLLIYVGTFLTLYLTWNPVGSNVLNGVHTRYIIPALALLPFVFNINKNKKIVNLNNYLIVLVISFLAGMIMQIVFHYY